MTLTEKASLFLDILGLLAIAGGIVGGFWYLIGPWALCLGGGVVLAGSAYAQRPRKPEAAS